KLDVKPFAQYYQSRIELSQANTRVEKSRLLPELSFSYMNQSFAGWHTLKDRTEQYYDGSTRFSSWMVGLNIPLFLKSYRARIQAASLMEQISQKEYEWSMLSLHMNISKAMQDYEKYTDQLHMLAEQEMPLVNQTLELSTQRLQRGEISYMEWIFTLRQVSEVRIQYLQTLREQWFAAITLHHLLTEF
ncbi:MAG: TolC family protein, partial [Thermoflavifilum sp.]|nr:TolC family protein [Thermoflavifilum sp.]